MKQNSRIEESLAQDIRKDYPEFHVGDTIHVHLRVVEGEKERIQVLTGVVMSRKGAKNSETFTLFREGPDGYKMERVFVLNSPKIAKIAVERKGKTRRSKLYYLRSAKGKSARIEEDVTI